MTDVFNRLTLALALWNGKDPIIKERMFGLSGPEGNHGEDVKDYWWYLDAIPSSAWLRWRYHYPQAAFPYEDLVTTNRGRSKFEPEYELLDTGVFDDDRYWIVEVHYAKASPTDVLMRVTVRNRGPETATLHVLPTLWFRNEWAWNPDQVKPELRAGPDGRSILATHPELGDYTLEIGPASDGTAPTLLFCENETNRERIEGVPNTTPYPKDGINDHLIGGTATVNPDGVGTKASPWYRLDVPAGETVELRLRLHKTARAAKPRTTTVPAVGAEAEVAVPAVGDGRHGGRGQRQGRGRRGRAHRSARTVLRVDHAPARGRGGRLLRGSQSRRHGRRRAAGHAPGVRRHALEQAVLRLQRRALARRRPGPAAAAPRAADRPQRDVAAFRGGRHHLDARSMGVPVVRRLGPRVPRGDVRPHRPGVREVPAPAAVPGVVPAPARGAAGVRVVVR